MKEGYLFYMALGSDTKHTSLMIQSHISGFSIIKADALMLGRGDKGLPKELQTWISSK